ncbi:hypothetical protein BC835DRAFT_1411039 [Cytidiella melzeri]|nr:hypothetical protein BC835DRAFT_1411039 [Cytidiella melzeri]
MDIGVDTRPLSMLHRPREWEAHQNGVTTNSPTKSSLVSKRRSAAVLAPPPGPPPTQPIPHLPPVQHYQVYDGLPHMADTTFDYRPAAHSPPQSYARPAASAGLAAVAAFQSRHVKYSPASTAASSTDNLSDSPPASRLHPGIKSPVLANEIVPDRLLLSPPGPRSTEQRPSSRRALTKALELAREAVKLDSTNDDPYGAVQAYARSVALLSEVMERVMRGEDSTESHRRTNGRRRSVVAQEEEVRRLKSIHDTYADRMNILSVIYSIPLPTASPTPSSSVSVSTVSTQPSSPTSPTSETSEGPRTLSRQHSQQSLDADISESFVDVADVSDPLLVTNTAMFSGGLSPSTPVAPSLHPYAAAPTTVPSRPPPPTPPRLQGGRSRASSTLPPIAPPPTAHLPPAPGSTVIQTPPDIPTPRSLKPPDVPGRHRGQSVSHQRTGSASRLAVLPEELEKGSDNRHQNDTLALPQADVDGRPRSRGSQRDSDRDSHPLPPLPSPAPSDLTTIARGAAAASLNSQSPNSSTFTQRSRGGSTFSVRSEASSTRDTLINASPTMGTIFRRRNETSAVPSPATSPTESSASSTLSRPPAHMPNMPAALRSRSESLSARRPSAASSTSYTYPQTAVPSGQPRKVSIPSRLNPNAPPSITINTALLSPSLSKPVLTPLVPPPPIPHGNIPLAPMSPLPPLAPPDPLRKPYHMMHLLRQTMVSKTGGYITRRLHVPQEVWSQGGAKLSNVPEKIRVVEVLSSALEEVQSWSVEYFGAGNVSSGMSMGIGSIGKREADLWATRLEEFSTVCDGVVSNFGKKLGVGEGFVTKKSSGFTALSGKLTRQFDKLTNAKNLDSPAVYVQVLSKLFNQAQILDEHTKAVAMQPMAPLYMAFPTESRIALEIKLRRASEFFAKVILTFVIRDMALLLDKYVKKCEKWLAE